MKITPPTKEQIHEQIAAQPRTPRYMARDQIAKKLDELTLATSIKRPKNALWG